MVPRGRLDISSADLIWAVSACFRSRRRCTTSLHSHWPTWQVLVALSVRTAWDAWLAEQHWPKGDEILVSAVTIPDMLRIIREHGLVPVPVPVEFDSLTVLPAEFERRITVRTRAALVAHLFGSRMPISPLAMVCRRRGIQLVEDAAQAFDRPSRLSKSESDVVLLSFGPIKTCTALGGAIVLLRDADMAGRLHQRLAAYPRQSSQEFFKRALRMCFLQALTWPPAFTALVSVLDACGVDWDRLLSRLTRGFAGKAFWARLRRQPSWEMIALLERRLATSCSRALEDRTRSANLLWSHMGAIERPGADAADHSHWVLPIVAAQPDRLLKALRSSGYDATRIASSLIQAANETCPADARWDRLLYLPNHPAADPVKLAATIETAVVER